MDLSRCGPARVIERSTRLIGELVISLELELLWGLRDHADRRTYGQNILGGREAVPRILDLFEQFDIAATWATVGFASCETKEELLESLPPVELWPRYRREGLSNYKYLADLGTSERDDPYYFGASLLRHIRQAPKQEVGTHTMSHFYCLEEGSTCDAFEADLRAAAALAERQNFTLRSIVFPRNQYAPEHLEICRRHGLRAYRGNPAGWPYRPAPGAGQGPLRRAARLVDSYTGLLGAHTHPIDGGGFRNVAASHFLRPRPRHLATVHPLHLATVHRAMTTAARCGRSFHLWWHPHNFGAAVEANMAALQRIIEHFEDLRGQGRMVSRAMGDVR